MRRDEEGGGGRPEEEGGGREVLNSIVFLRCRTPLRYFASKELGLGAASARLWRSSLPVAAVVAARHRRPVAPPPVHCNRIALQSHCITLQSHCIALQSHCVAIALH